MFKAILSNQIWNSVRDWKGWENSGPMKSVDAVVKEHRLFIVLVVLKKSQVIKRKTHKIHAWYVDLRETTREKEGQVLLYVVSDNINGLALTERHRSVTVYRSLQPAAAA